MNTYTVKNTQFISRHTLLITLRHRSGSKLRFYPGQYAALGFKRFGRPSPMRCFSIVSSPNRPDELQFAVKVYGDFTSALSKLETEDTVFVHGPFGNFVIDEQYDRNVILLAGGIGVTPYMSMVRYATEAKLSIPITLLYSCQNQDSIPFYEELLEHERQNPLFKVFFFVTEGGREKLGKGRILNTRIEEKQLNQLTNQSYNRFTYFVCGPKGFMHAMKEILGAHDTDPDRIITEEFTPTSQDNAVSTSPKYSISRWTYSLTAASLVLGTAFIMTLDVSRALPKLVSAQSIQTPTTSQSSNASSSNSTNYSSSSSQQQSTSQSNPSTYSQSSQSQYQTPVTSVS
jgi:ferredoxin-NADP reductase